MRAVTYNFFNRSSTNYTLPAKLCCGRLIAVPTPGQVADRVFFLGGYGAQGTPTNLAYEWNESGGWTKFGTLPTLTSYKNIVAMLYNTK